MKKQKHIKGQTLVEFALILPLLFLLVFGLFEFGRFVLFYSVLNTAVREGTRYAIVQPACDFTSNPANCQTNPSSYSYLSGTFTSGCCCSSTSEANVRICEAIEDKYFNLGGLSSSEITITFTGTDDPKVNIRIEHDYDPLLPGLGLIGNIQIAVESNMLLSPVATLY